MWICADIHCHPINNRCVPNSIFLNRPLKYYRCSSTGDSADLITIDYDIHSEPQSSTESEE